MASTDVDRTEPEITLKSVPETETASAKWERLTENVLVHAYCDECVVGCRTPEEHEKHLASAQHKRNAAIKAISQKITEGDVKEDNSGVKLTVSKDMVNMNSNSVPGAAIIDKSPTVQIQYDLDLYKPEDNDHYMVSFRLDNPTENRDLLLKEAYLATNVDATFISVNELVYTSNGLAEPLPAELKCGAKLEIRVKCGVPSQAGCYRIPIAFYLSDISNNKESDGGGDVAASQTDQQFMITRLLEFTVTNKIIKKLEPSNGFEPTEWQKRRVVIRPKSAVKNIVPASIPLPDEGRNKLEEYRGLAAYSIPLRLRLVASKNFRATSEMNESLLDELALVKETLQSELNTGNHLTKFRMMLFLEEMQQEVDIRNFDMNGIHVKRVPRSRLFELSVPGLAENRPSLLRGDHVFLRHQGQDGAEYQGIVHHLNADNVHLGFGPEFENSHRKDSLYTVRFTFGRGPLKMMQRGLQLAKDCRLIPILFPDSPSSKVPSSPSKKNIPKVLELFDTKLSRNPQQMEAVRSILAGLHQPAPYIIFGPPGTGKTVTVVEAIKQVLKADNHSRVLACTPSNAAADLLTQRLLRHLKPEQILRMNALSRSPASVPPLVMNVSNVSGSGFFYPSRDSFSQCRVTVTTLATAGRLVSAKFASNFFSHIFIDEAGQATEPETLVSIGGLADVRGGHVILAGDPQQLGPVLRSVMAAEHGLGTSLLERLMKNCDPYKRQEGSSHYDSRYLTKLVRNYRSHPDILKIPSEMFYDSELEAFADKKKRESLATWSALPVQGFPMIFHGVCGDDMREEHSPSFFNPSEISVIKLYIDLLMKSGNVKDSDIGIIAPYRKQVGKIKELLRCDLDSYGLISVGSVEEFQGAERRVIIISTVRSNPNYLSTDKSFKLGFLRNPKRFNTAVTRAKAMLIVIGNPWILERDPCWRKVLELCNEKGAYVGVPFTLSQESDGQDDGASLIDRLLGGLHIEADPEELAKVNNEELPVGERSALAVNQ